MVRRALLYLLIASPALYGADKTAETLLEVVRDIGGLQEQIKALQKSIDARFADMTQASADQGRAAAEQSAKALTALGDSVQKSLHGQQDQQTKALDAIAGVGSQVQSVVEQLNTMRQAMNDLTAATNRLSTQMSDLASAVKSLQAGKTDNSGGPASPDISATDLFANAESDRLGGNLDIALREYSDYVAKFGNTPQAPDAQYYIGSIQYSNSNWDGAVRAFDTLLQTYPDSKRTPEGTYYRADSLARLNRWQEANDALKELRERYPDNPLAKRGLTVKPPAQK